MKQRHYFMETTDGIRLFVRKWDAVNRADARIILIHGFSEHSGRYKPWAERFAAENISVLTVDLRGHGQSQGIRGHTPGFKRLLLDLDQLMEEHPAPANTPTFIYGQSLGGGIVINYGLTRRDGYEGIIATSPWLRLSTEPKAFALLLSRGLKIIAPRAVRNSKLNINYLSHDPEVIKRYEHDPLTHRQITPHLFFGARKAGLYALHNAHKLNKPLLLMHGTGDKITSLKASEQFVQKAQKHHKDVRFIRWPELYHELHQEKQKDRVFQTILQWLKEKTKNSQTHEHLQNTRSH